MALRAARRRLHDPLGRRARLAAPDPGRLVRGRGRLGLLLRTGHAARRRRPPVRRLPGLAGLARGGRRPAARRVPRHGFGLEARHRPRGPADGRHRVGPADAGDRDDPGRVRLRAGGAAGGGDHRVGPCGAAPARLPPLERRVGRGRRRRGARPLGLPGPFPAPSIQLGDTDGVLLGSALPSRLGHRPRTPAISNLSPNPTNAGTIEPNDFLTITGSGFGNVPGKVEFKTADNGGSTYITVPNTKTDYVSWSDNSITVKVPAQAGTGTISVNGKISTQILNINYALEDINSDFYMFQDTTRQRYYLRNLFDSIGYIFKYNTTSGFSSNSSAKAAFERAMATWRCKTGINWQANGTTSEGNVADSVNVVMFDNTLDAGTLAITSYDLAAQGTFDCFQENTVWYLQDINMRFATVPMNGYTWQFGPALPTSRQYDFETVAVHELGHAHGLAHRIAPGEVMNYSITNGTTIRVPSNVEFEGAQVKMNYSTVPTCFDPDGGGTPMTIASCVLPVHILSFKAELQHQNVLLNWQTASEYNTAYFIVQRSVDGIHFNDISTVNAAGNSSTINKYQLNDNITGLDAGTIYYRLKETDKDGKTTLSGINMVTIAGKLFMVYPNPAKTYVRVAGQSIAFIELLDATGKPVYKKNVSNENVTTVNTSAFSKGIYTLLIKDSKGNTENRKLILE